MKFNFLTHKLMANNILKSVVATAVIATGVSAETPNFNSTTTVAVSGESIDFKSKIAKIDIQLVQIQTKISIIEQKSELTSSDKRDRYHLNKEFKKLTAEKLVIKQSEGQQLDKKVAIIDKDITNGKNTIDKKINTEKQLDTNAAITKKRIENKKEQLSIAEQKLAALDRVSKVLHK